MWQAFGLS